jgi:hypothetical protein
MSLKSKGTKRKITNNILEVRTHAVSCSILIIDKYQSYSLFKNNESDSEQGVNIINRKRQLIQLFTLALTLVSSIVVITSLSQAANGQLRYSTAGFE